MAYTHEETISNDYEKSNGADRVEYLKKSDVETSSQGSEDEKVQTTSTTLRSRPANPHFLDDVYQDHGLSGYGIPCTEFESPTPMDSNECIANAIKVDGQSNPTVPLWRYSPI